MVGEANLCSNFSVVSEQFSVPLLFHCQPVCVVPILGRGTHITGTGFAVKPDRGFADRGDLLAVGSGAGVMHRHLIRGLSGVLLLLVSMGLLSTRQYAIQNVTDVQELTERTSASEEQQKLALVDVMDHSSRELKEEHKGDIVSPMAETSLLLEDLFIAVKTTQKFHRSRIGLLLDTWISRVRDQVGMRVRGRRIEWTLENFGHSCPEKAPFTAA